MRVIKAFCLTVLVVLVAACSEIVEETDISKESLSIVAPKAGTIVSDSMVTFTWNEIVDADAYQIQVATPNFVNASQVLLDSLVAVDSTFSGTSANTQLIDGIYEWRVKAVNSAYETLYSTAEFSVNTQNN